MSTSFQKPEWRERTLKFVRKAKPLWDGDTLRCSVIDTMGMSGGNSFALWRPYLTQPMQFIGCDHDIETVFHWRANVLNTMPIGERFQVAHGDVYRLSATTDSPLGVFLFDGMDQAGLASWWDTHRGLLRQIVTSSIRRWGTAVVVINKTIDRSDGAARELDLYAHELAQTFYEYGVTKAGLLGSNPNVETLKRGDHQYVGAFEIYRSDDHVLRMATIRLCFTAKHCTLERTS